METKICKNCGKEKPLSSFGKVSNRQDKTKKYHMSSCHTCDGNRESSRRAKLKYKYGITPEEYDRLLSEQAGGCAICGGTNGKKPLYVDHDHITGQVRGLLCHGCNVAIGHMKDDASLLRRAAVYLERG